MANYMQQPPLIFPPNRVPKLLPNGDKEHPCGCVTFWHHYTKQPSVVFYRKPCAAHKGYAQRLGLVAA